MFKLKESAAWIIIIFLMLTNLVQTYRLNSVIEDCKILGMFRIGHTAYGCRPSVSTD